ncbi:MAG: IPT/TIG domain-containing protein [Deltaproteobacteria bacterium]|nr:IPT/TIG domain-containing protein [Deltaproteobacteria bacterium]
MVRKRMITAIAMASVLATVGVESAALGASSTSLLLPQSTAFSVLGHSCGGIQEQALATGFDAASGYPTGNVYLQTRCGGSGRGGGYHSNTYSAWVDVTWDYTGTVVSYIPAGAPTSIDPTFSAFDSFGNEIHNQLNAVNVLPANCTVGDTTYCSYRAYLSLSSTFVPPPRVTSVSVTFGPAAGGTGVTVTGTGFTGATAVTFGATAAPSFTVNGDTSITAVSPAASAGTVDVTVTTPGGTSSASATDQFTFVAAPAVSGLSPDGGTVDGGTLVAISGRSFIEVSAVNFGDTPAGFTVNDDSSITAVSPAAEAVDTVHVTVVTVGGMSATTAADEFTYTPSTATSACGDGKLDPGEQCDDGAANGTPGDCCTVTCTFQPAGTACTDDGSLCTSDVCDAAGMCTHPISPWPACTPPDVAAGASLIMRTRTSGGNEAQFQWGEGPVVSLADFGNPSGSDLLQLCVYDQTGPDTYVLALTGSPSLSGGGAWTAGPAGWRFRSKTGAPDGITGVTLKAATMPLKAKVRVKAMNSPGFALLPLQSAPSVVAQVKTSLGTCWGATFSTPTVNTAKEFKAKSD